MLVTLMPYIIYISIGLLFVVIFLMLHFYSNTKKKIALINSQLQSQQLIFDDLELSYTVGQETRVKEIEVIKQAIIESEQVTKQLEHRIKTLQQNHQHLSITIEQLQEQQPEDKLYSRASKLVALGASLEEIVRECDIPVAEAKMLLSVHKRN